MNPLLGLTQSTQDRESQAMELNALERLDARQERSEQENLAAQQQEQQVYEHFFEQSKSLLGKDRERVNRKFLDYQKQIKEAISSSGVSKADFMKNGGLSKINEIKNGLMQSEEYSRYLTNQENNAKLIQAMSSPATRDLVNPNDVASMEAYNNNEDGGEITYSGLMARVEIPPANQFEFGQEIPIDKISNYNGNMLRIMANYKMVNPNAPDINLENPADQQRLTKFMYQMGYGGMGSNQQMAIQREKNRRWSADQKKKSNKVSLIGTLTNTFYNQEKGLTPEQIIEGQNAGGYIEGITKDNPLFKKMFSNVNPGFYGQKMTDADSYNPLTTGIDALINLNQSNYGVKEARQIMASNTNNIAKLALQKDIKDGYIEEYKPEGATFFDADGSRLNKVRTENPERYKVLGLISGFKTKVTNDKQGTVGEEVLMMDAYNGNGTIDQEETTKINGSYMGNEIKGQANMTVLLALKSDSGQTVYKEINLENLEQRKMLEEGLGASDDLTSIVNQDKQNMAVNNYIDAQSDFEDKQVDAFNREQGGVVEESPGYTHESYQYYKPGSGGSENRNDLIKSFYVASGMLQSQAGPIEPEQIQSLTKNNLFTGFMSKAGEEFIDESVKSFDKGEDEIIDTWFEKAIEKNGYQESSEEYKEIHSLAQEWKNMLAITKQNKNN